MRDDKGKMLELIIADIERLISDNPTTKIKLRHKVTDRDGFEREIDVYVEVEVNRKLFRYAIECKNYKENSKIEMSDIDEFYSKIANQGMKGIFLTTSKFQKNAIEKAKKLNINLYMIEDSDDDFIQSYSLFHKRFQILSIAIGSPEFEESKQFNLNEIYVGESKKKWKAENYITKVLKVQCEKAISQNMKEAFKEFLENDEDSVKLHLGVTKDYVLHGELNLVFFKNKGIFHPIPFVRSNVRLWIDFIENVAPKSHVYKSIETGQVYATFLSQNIVMNTKAIGLFNAVKIEGEDEYNFSIVTHDGGVTKWVDLVKLGEFSDSELTISKTPIIKNENK